MAEIQLAELVTRQVLRDLEHQLTLRGAILRPFTASYPSCPQAVSYRESCSRLRHELARQVTRNLL